jgi:hypothetical protein
MKNAIIPFFLLAVTCFNCAYDDLDGSSAGCTTRATVVDLTGLDGCGWVFELEDGTRLEPMMVFRCGTPPMPDEALNPLDKFEFVNGKRVLIGYEETHSMSICMVGPTVKITCITEVTTPSNE